MRDKIGGFIRGAALFVMVLFVPALRSCAAVSYGFPTVVVEAVEPFTIKAFHPWHLALNALVLAGVFLALYAGVFRTLRANRKVREGLKFLYLYNGLTYVGFWGVYWLIASKNEVAGMLVMTYSFLLYGPLFLLNDLDLLSEASRGSPLFGDPEDIKIRVVYVAMSCVWFAVGWLKRLVADKMRSAGAA